MKTSKIIFATALSSVLFVACNDLDTAPLGSTVTSEQKESVYSKQPEMIEAGVNGIATSFSVYANLYYSNGVGFGHYDFGYPSVMLQLDSRGMDLVSRNIGYNWYSYSLMFRDITTTTDYTLNIWTNLYNQIYAANTVLSSLDEDPEDATEQFYVAQALAFRAFDYFVLAQLYQFNYVNNKDKACVPVVLNTNAEEVANAGGVKRNTVEEVYTQVMTDISKAIELLEKTSVKPESGRAGKKFISLATAYGIRARINLTMQNWNDAANDAASAIANTSATPYSRGEVSKPTFADAGDNSWMWGILIEEKDAVATSGIVNWISHMGSLNYGYASVGAWRACNKALYESIPATDIRKGWWLNDKGISANLDEKQQAYIDEAGVDPYTQVKFAPYEDEIYSSTNANDVPLMRVEEMYLILAEGQAMGGAPATGANTLQTFVNKYRNPRYTCEATTAAEVQEAVYQQRRIELWGEGLSYFDLLRLNKTIDRRGGGFEAEAVFLIQPNNPILIYQIPNSEVEANPLLGENNEAGTRPSPVADL